jgi:hypothetical protein
MSADSAPIFDSAASRTREQKPLAVGTIRGALPRSLVRVGPCAHANAARAHNAPVGTGDGSRITSDAGCQPSPSLTAYRIMVRRNAAALQG